MCACTLALSSAARHDKFLTKHEAKCVVHETNRLPLQRTKSQNRPLLPVFSPVYSYHLKKIVHVSHISPDIDVVLKKTPITKFGANKWHVTL